MAPTVCAARPAIVRAQQAPASRPARAPGAAVPKKAVDATAALIMSSAVLFGAVPGAGATGDIALGAKIFNANCGARPAPHRAAVGAPLPRGREALREDNAQTQRARPRARRGAARQTGASLATRTAAACHAGGNNSVDVQKTLKKEAISQYLTGGLNEDAIIYQARGRRTPRHGARRRERTSGCTARAFPVLPG